MSGAALVQFSSLDLKRMLPLGRQALERSLSSTADDAGLEPPLHHMLCVAAMKSPDIKPTAAACRPYLNLFHAGVVVAIDERDLAELLELSGMPCAAVESTNRGVFMVFIAGNLSQWRDAMLRGCQKEVSRDTRATFNAIHREFQRVGIAGAFEFTKRESQRDHTFFLEHKS